MIKPYLITIGDIDGIGIELLISLWNKKKINNFILLTNVNLFKKYLLKNKNKLEYIELKEKKINQGEFNIKRFNIFNIKAQNKFYNTYNSLIKSYELSKKINIMGVVTLPLNKYLISKYVDNKFIGQTEFFQKMEGKDNSLMIFLHQKIIITTMTTHISLKKVSKIISTKNFISNKINILIKTLKTDFKIIKPKILISGINPHSGEMGKIGKEELDIIIPMIKKINKNNKILYGPCPGDSMVNKINLKNFDCLVFMYHDQALIPFKILSDLEGVNYTGGLNLVRVSPDHGTAYDLVGKNIANSKSLLNCFKYINKIIKYRS